MKPRTLAVLLGAASLLIGGVVAGAQPSPSGADVLRAGFVDPPNSARPRVWWHWMNGNVTKDGIQKDLEWMSRTGIGGLQNFDAALETPQVVDRRLIYMSPEWKDAFRFSVSLADQLGLEFAIAASPGWSETGGPWVPPQDGIKKLVWSETIVRGGARFKGTILPPPATTGPFADMQPRRYGLVTANSVVNVERYEDIAVLAVPAPDRPSLPLPRMTVSGREIDAAALMDGSFEAAVEFARERPGGDAEIMIEFLSPQTIRAVTLGLPVSGRSIFSPPDIMPVLEAETMPGEWRRIRELPLIGDTPTTVSFAPVTAARFRMRFQAIRAQSQAERVGAAPGVRTDTFRPPVISPSFSVTEVRLSTDSRVDRFEVKGGYSVGRDYYEIEAGGPADEGGTPRGSVIDLTQRLTPDGQLDWTPPPGRWKVLRFGWALTGTMNHPATAEATGLEVDKLDRAAVERYMTTYLGMFRDTVGAELFGARGLQAVLTDSIEVGPFNWTPALPKAFSELRGYDAIPWLPALAGEIIGSRSETDRFLYDYRRTISDLISSAHYGGVKAVAHREGLKVYGEALEAGRPSLGDDMTMRSHADIPMAALWTYRPETGPRQVFLSDLKGGASVAHIYGQNLLAAETLTSGFNYWSHAPSDLKPMIDLAFAYGVNLPVIHTSVHQPVDDKQPGLSLLIFGQFFNRHETWSEMARPWIDYISRSSFMLQQGHYFADVAYFFGEEAPLTGLYFDRPPVDAPKLYAYDFLSPDALQSHVKVTGGRVVSDGGTAYRAIYLGGSSEHMTVGTLRRLRDLVATGATIIGPPPTRSPSLTDDPRAFADLVGELWGGGAFTRVGEGRVITSRDPDETLQALGIEPDFEIADAKDRQVLFLHRRLLDGDAYFLTNRQDRHESFEARFRVSGLVPEIWHADSGEAAAVSYRIEGDQTVIPLEMLPHDAFFVVFRKPAVKPSQDIAETRWTVATTLASPWRLEFQAGRGAPSTTQVSALKSLSEFEDPTIRYFSGVTTYHTTFRTPRGYKAGSPLSLDLGKVGDVAEVFVNGRPAGISWKAPNRLDIKSLVRPGSNSLEVRVANLWVNRLIGDAQPGATKVAFTTIATYHPDAPLRPSGLLGPVKLLQPD